MEWIKSSPLDPVNAVAGGLVGLALVVFVSWIRKPTIKNPAFDQVATNFGTLHKLKFQVRGQLNPGLHCLRIDWDGRSVFAKWDETPNPLDNDNLASFRPELVPQTFFQPLFSNQSYTVPIIIENNGIREIFSGWWFGRNMGFGPNPEIGTTSRIRLTIFGGNLFWTQEFEQIQICSTTT